MHPVLALALAALAILFWRVALRLVLIAILFLIILGIATLLTAQVTRSGSPTPSTTAVAPIIGS
jgi:hypothetical protein